MRMKRSRIGTYYMKNKEVIKDNEGGTREVYDEPVPFKGEVWPAGGKVQAEIYGERLSYIRNVKIEGNYVTTTDQKGVIHYVYPDGLDVVESQGLCLYVPSDAEPDYKVVSIKPYRPLRLEVEKI